MQFAAILLCPSNEKRKNENQNHIQICRTDASDGGNADARISNSRNHDAR